MKSLTITEALRLIAGRAPSVSYEATRALLSTSDVVQHMRYNAIAQAALGDPNAEWSKEEREAIVALITVRAVRSVNARDAVIRVRVTAAEKRLIETQAMKAGLTVSAFIRQRLLA